MMMIPMMIHVRQFLMEVAKGDDPDDSLVPGDDPDDDSLGSEEAAFWLLISELEGSDSEFGFLPVEVRKCGKPKKKKQKQQLNSEEALPSKEAYSSFNISNNRRSAVPRRQTKPSRDMAVDISNSAAG